MTPNVVTVSVRADTTLAWEVAADCCVEHLVVMRGAELAGILCTCDLWSATPTVVGGVMSRPAVTISASATVAEAAARVRETGVGCLPVLASGRVVGIVTRGDLARIGVLDISGQFCASCGSHHHVRPRAGYDCSFCSQCRDRVSPVASYDELGWGD